MGDSVEWPEDADGDVMRSLQRDGFNFSREAEIDFNIDFVQLAPDPVLIGLLKARLPHARVSVENDSILVQLRALVTYRFVTEMQTELTQISAAFGGKCESWGVLHASTGQN